MTDPLSLFAYGTLRAPELLAAVIGHTAPAVDAIARGHRVVYYPGRTYPALIAARGHDAPGTLVSGLSQADITQLDLFEGSEYERRGIKVRVEGKLVSAEVYWPLASIAADAPSWRYEDWRARDPAVAGTTGAAALRARLIAEGSGP